MKSEVHNKIFHRRRRKLSGNFHSNPAEDLLQNDSENEPGRRRLVDHRQNEEGFPPSRGLVQRQTEQQVHRPAPDHRPGVQGVQDRAQQQRP